MPLASGTYSGGVGLTGPEPGWQGSGPTGGAFASGYGGSDLAAYLQQMYQANLDAQLAQLQAAYEQNMAESRYHDDLITRNYLSQRSQAAAQNDLQRMYMNEMGAVHGLNTGAYGQLALALSSDLQGSLARLGAAEAQDLAENNLLRQQLGIGYRGDTVSATAQSNSSLAGALYNEYVRQTEAAQEEARWQAQLAYQQQQDALAQQNWERQFQYGQEADRQSSAYSMALALLQSGVMPDSSTLAAAGIARSDAENLIRAAQTAALRSNQKSVKTVTPDNAPVADAVIEGMLSAGYTEEQIKAAGYSGDYFKQSSGGKGSSYDAIWSRARTMYDEGKSDKEIEAYLNKFSEDQLTNDGLDFIMNSLNLYGYRDVGKRVAVDEMWERGS